VAKLTALDAKNLLDGDLAWPQIQWLDTCTILVVDRIRDALEGLAVEERAYAGTMSPGRFRQFAAGRTVARRAMELLKYSPNPPILIASNGHPAWPSGIAGSISHIATHAAALVSSSAHHPSVGIDIDDQRLLGSAAKDLMTDEEVQLVLRQNWTADAALAQNLVFSAKESIFKYQFPLTAQRELEFNEVRLRASERPGVLAASCLLPDPHLQMVIARARLFHQQIQGIRTCWALPEG
jgi:4'-phosphopantetheinyl transferase EntD